MPSKPRGLAAVIDPARRREIARMGGNASAKKGTLYRFTLDDHKKGGTVAGGIAASKAGYMAQIGKTGGTKTQTKRKAK